MKRFLILSTALVFILSLIGGCGANKFNNISERDSKTAFVSPQTQEEADLFIDISNSIRQENCSGATVAIDEYFPPRIQQYFSLMKERENLKFQVKDETIFIIYKESKMSFIMLSYGDAFRVEGLPTPAHM